MKNERIFHREMGPGKRILSIDIGMKNFCFCYYDSGTQEILEWTRLMLPPKDKQLLIPRLVSFVHAFTKEHSTVATEASVVAVEQQIAASMRIMEAVLHSQFVGRARSINPRQVKNHFRALYPDDIAVHKKGLKSRSIDYVLGKKLAVAVSSRLLEHQAPEWQDQFKLEPKKDDLADCFLQAVYVGDLIAKGKF